VRVGAQVRSRHEKDMLRRCIALGLLAVSGDGEIDDDPRGEYCTLSRDMRADISGVGLRKGRKPV
jgi:hypothetical protein